MQIALLILFAVALAIAWWYWSGTQPPRRVSARIDAPREVAVGEEFTLSVHLTNEREDRPFRLTEIFVDQSFDDAFTLVGVTPEPTLRRRFKLAVVVLYKFDLSVPPRSSELVAFRLRATREGLAQGDFLVNEGRRTVKLPATVKAVRE